MYKFKSIQLYVKGVLMSGGADGSESHLEGPNPYLNQNGDETKKKDCGELIIQTKVNSPDPDILKNVMIGDLLDVQIISETGPLVVIHSSGRLGSITHYLFKEIKDCIKEGHRYFARVTKISFGLCEIVLSKSE